MNHPGGGLLGAKIVPPTVPGGFLRRPRLQERLDAGVSGPLTLVSAGPGWGKTLVVAPWARAHLATTPAARVAWLALDRDDNEPRLFWTAVISSLGASGAVAAADPLAALAFGPGVTAQGLRRLREGLRGLAAPVVLVLDDFHVIDHPEILESVAVLLRHESPLRLVLIGRTDPVLPLHRLRVGGGLLEIRAVDLAFDQREAEEFLRLNGQALPASDVARLVERTEGWATGLRLAAMFLTRDSTAGAGEFAGDDRAVTEYLLAEVIASRPAHMRSFLLATSIPDRICGDLADVLVDGGRGRRRLEELERANTFISALGPHRRWYRYHPLLREALRHQLGLEDPELMRSLHRRAASWFAGHAAPVQGLRHAAAAQDWPLLGELFVTTAGPRILSADRAAINEALALIPDTELTSTAALAACAAARLEYAGRYAEIAPVLARARRMLARDGTPYQAATAAVIGLWDVAVARVSADMPMLLATCTAVLDGLSETDETFPAAEQCRAIALNNQGGGRADHGDGDCAVWAAACSA